jgi:hypothetical protein
MNYTLLQCKWKEFANFTGALTAEKIASSCYCNCLNDHMCKSKITGEISAGGVTVNIVV